MTTRQPNLPRAQRAASHALNTSGGSTSRTLRRAVFLFPAGLALLAGLDAALVLLDLPAPVSGARLPQVHGMLLVLGFVGTVISLERSVALARPAGFAAPALLGLGGLLLLSPAPLIIGKSVLLAGALAVVLVYLPLYFRQLNDAVLVQALGAVLAAGAALMWLGGLEVRLLLPWLVGFIVLTIGGERLELARVAINERASREFSWLAAALALGVVAALLWPPAGYPILGVTLLALVGWLSVHDVARRTIRATGQIRFMAGCLLAGYGWLAVAGMIWLLHGSALSGPVYDALVHAVFLGFTLSMIMAHASVILPAVLRVAVPYHPVMWVPAALLHTSLVLRLAVGDARGLEWAWQVGGVLNIAAVLLFVAVAVWSAVRTGLAARASREST
jgi:hypothetical protein